MTPQVHEKLIFNGREVALSYCPPLPGSHRQLVELTDAELRNREIDDPLIFTDACWRRYIGTWEIRDDNLFLVDITGRFVMTGDEPIPADWFTGILQIPLTPALRGSILLSLGTVIEDELNLQLVQGRLVRPAARAGD